MKPAFYFRISCALIFLFATVSFPAKAAIFYLNEQTNVFTPSSRGGSNTIYFGWELFGSEGSGGPSLVDDATPDIGSATGGRIVTTNGEDHTPFSAPGAAANIYTFTGTLSEDVTAATDGILGSGFTTILIQGITAPQGNPTFFSGTPEFSDINGVAAEYVSGLNANGIEQFFVRYNLPGNQSSYTFSMTGDDMHFSLDRLVIDTFWSATGYQADEVFAAAPEPGRVALAGMGLISLIMRRRRRA